jgi:hypothetical protein
LPESTRVSGDRLSYDPAHPVHTRGARYGPECIVNQTPPDPGVISYLSEPLSAPKDVTGATRVVLWVTSDAASADFTAKLIDVYPDGYAAPLLDGATRINRVATGQPQQVVIEVGTTSNLFETGHRIRIDIAGSSFPKLEPNAEAAHDIVYHDARYPSYVDLPVNSR